MDTEVVENREARDDLLDEDVVPGTKEATVVTADMQYKHNNAEDMRSLRLDWSDLLIKEISIFFATQNAHSWS